MLAVCMIIVSLAASRGASQDTQAACAGSDVDGLSCSAADAEDYAPRWKRPYSTMRQVERFEWTPDNLNFKEKFFEADRPIVLTNTPAELWPARQKWSFNYLRDNLNTSWPAKISNTTRVFRNYGAGLRANCAALGLNDSHCGMKGFAMHKYTAAQFVDLLGPEKPYVYGSKHLNDFPVGADIDPQSILALWDGRAYEVATEKKTFSTPSLWMGSAGVWANTHYDDAHNCFVQMLGTKRVRMVSPRYWMHLRVGPTVFPNHRQSHLIDFDNLDTERYPDLKEIEIWEATLSPGEMLYLPLFWFHSVKSVTACASINQFSTSGDYLFMQTITQEMPFSDLGWSSDRRRAALLYMVPMVLAEILKGNEWGLPAKGNNPMKLARTFIRTALVRMWQPHIPDVLQRRYNCPTAEWDDQLAEFMAEFVPLTIEMFNRISTYDRRLVYSVTWYEKWVLRMVGPKATPSFIRSCLSRDPFDKAKSPFPK